MYIKGGLIGYILHVHIFLVCSHFHNRRQRDNRKIVSTNKKKNGNTNEIYRNRVHWTHILFKQDHNALESRLNHNCFSITVIIFY